MQLIRAAGPDLSGGTFGPDTDFEKLLHSANTADSS
jgi:hypothetical protein